MCKERLLRAALWVPDGNPTPLPHFAALWPIAYGYKAELMAQTISFCLILLQAAVFLRLAKDLSWHLSSVIKQEMRPPWPLSSILSRGSEEICGGYSWRSGTGDGEKGCL